MSELYNVKSAISRNERNKLNETFKDILARFANLQRQINMIAGGEELDKMLQEIDELVTDAQNVTELTHQALDDLTGTLDSFQEQINNMAGGSPQGTFSTYNALIAKYPNGAEGVMLTTDNGHWYWWNSVTNKWENGGVYQASGIADKSTTKDKIASDVLRLVTKDNVFPQQKSEWESGSINANTDELTATTSRIRTKNYIIVTNPVFKITPPPNLSVQIYKYDENFNALGTMGWSATERTIVFANDEPTKYIKLLLMETGVDSGQPMEKFDSIGVLTFAKTHVVNGVNWRYGSILGDLSENNAVTRIKSDAIKINAWKTVTVNAKDNTSVSAVLLDRNGAEIGRVSSFTKTFTLTTTQESYLRIIARYDNDSNIDNIEQLANLVAYKIDDYKILNNNFKQGGINALGVINTATTRVHLPFKVPKDCVINVEHPSTHSHYLRIYKDGGFVKDAYALSDWSQSRKHMLLADYEYYIVLRKNDDSDITPTQAQTLVDVQILNETRSKTTLKVASHNVGLFGYGWEAGISQDEIAKLENWRTFLATENIDVYVMQEYTDFIDRNKTMRTQTFYSNWYKYQKALNFPYGYGYFSKYPMFDYVWEQQLQAHETRGSRKLTKMYTMIDGKKVALFNAHLIPGKLDSEYETRAENHLEIIEAIKQEEYFILFGDFNPWKDTRYTQPYLDAGFKVSLLGDFFPSFNTAENNTICIDNVITSANINIDNVTTHDDLMTSDHAPVITTITIY